MSKPDKPLAEEYNLSQMEVILEDRGLSENSRKTYLRNLKSFAKGNEGPIEKAPQRTALMIGDLLKTNEEVRNRQFTSTSVKKAKIASLLVAIDANKESKIYKHNYGTDVEVIDWLRGEAVKEQKAYHKIAATKSPKEDKNWVDWPQILKKAGEVRKEFNDYLDKKGVAKPTNNAFVGLWKVVKKELTKEERAIYKAGDRTPVIRKHMRYFDPYAKLFNKPFMTKLMNALVATLYTELPPRRLDWAKLHFITEEDWAELCDGSKKGEGQHPSGESGEGESKVSSMDCDELVGNEKEKVYYVIPSIQNLFSSKSYIVYGRDAGKSKQDEELRVDNLPSTLRTLVGTLIGTLLRINPDYYVLNGVELMVGAKRIGPYETIEYEGVSYDDREFEVMTENGLGKRVKSVFSGKYGGVKKNITATLLRKIFISAMFKGDTAKKVKIAQLMNHSVKIQQMIYNKEGNVSADDFMKLESNKVAAKSKKMAPLAPQSKVKGESKN